MSPQEVHVSFSAATWDAWVQECVHRAWKGRKVSYVQGEFWWYEVPPIPLYDRTGKKISEDMKHRILGCPPRR